MAALYRDDPGWNWVCTAKLGSRVVSVCFAGVLIVVTVAWSRKLGRILAGGAEMEPLDPLYFGGLFWAVLIYSRLRLRHCDWLAYDGGSQSIVARVPFRNIHVSCPEIETILIDETALHLTLEIFMKGERRLEFYCGDLDAGELVQRFRAVEPPLRILRRVHQPSLPRKLLTLRIGPRGAAKGPSGGRRRGGDGLDD